MHIWTLERWKKDDALSYRHLTGLRVYIQSDVDIAVKEEVKAFCNWLRQEYYFPFRVNVFVRSDKFIRAQDGSLVSATFFEPLSKQDVSYAKIAAGDYNDMLLKYGQNNALAAILGSISHELTHYFQWINQIKLTDMGMERQAKQYAKFIVWEYQDAN